MWRSGNLEIGGRQFIYEILLSEFPVKCGIFGGRIYGLYLYDENDQLVAKYDRGWILLPPKGTDASEAIKIISREHNFERKRTA